MSELNSDEFGENVRSILDSQQNDDDSIGDYDEDLPALPIYNEDLEKLIVEAYQRQVEIKEERTEINGKNQELRAGLNKKFLDKKAWDIVVRIMSMPDDELIRFDTTMRILRKTLNRPEQIPLDI